MQNYCLIVQYDGTDYAGYQVQPKQPTIQGALEQALGDLSKQPVRIIGAGRTDAGVHAEGQVVSFCTDNLSVPIDRLPLAMNRILPPDIRVVHSRYVPSDFHARYSAKRKTYRYQIYEGRIADVFLRRYALWMSDSLDWGRIRECTALFVGKHDFSAFAASGSSVKTTTRTMFSVRVEDAGQVKMIRFTADGFLYNMVRNIVGTLLDVGRGRLVVDDVVDIMASKDRRLAGATAPPMGLFLEKVEYA